MNCASKGLFGALMAGVVLATGCMGGDHGGGERAYQAISIRADAHHTAAVGAADVASLLTETQGYAEEMPGLMDDMMGSCADMMGSGMMGGGDMDRVGELTGRMSTAVDAHRGRMMGMTDLGAMRAECDAHRAAMAGMLDEMQGMMSSGGMM